MKIHEPDLKVVNTIIGIGSELRGEFKAGGVLRIDGFFSGELKTDGRKSVV